MAECDRTALASCICVVLGRGGGGGDGGSEWSISYPI